MDRQQNASYQEIESLFRIKQLSRVRGRVTGFEGKAGARSIYPNGCVRIEVLPPVDKDGKWVDGKVFDDADLDIIEPPVDATIAPEKPKKTGGPDVRIPVRR